MATVLIVDDTAAHRLVHRMVIEGLVEPSVKVREADGPAEALEAMHALAAVNEEVLVLTDHVMPGRTGIELVRTFSNEHPDARFRYILVTSLTSLAASDPADRAVVHEVLDKPADIGEVETAFARVLAEWQNWRRTGQTGPATPSCAAEVK